MGYVAKPSISCAVVIATLSFSLMAASPVWATCTITQSGATAPNPVINGDNGNTIFTGLEAVGTLTIDGADCDVSTSGTDNLVYAGADGLGVGADGTLLVQGGATLRTIDLEAGTHSPAVPGGSTGVITITGAGTQVIVTPETGLFSGEFRH